MTLEKNKIHAGNCLEVMKAWPANVIDTIITDPPYGIRFMGQAWDGADIEKTIKSKMRHTPRTDTHGGFSIENRAWAAGEYDRSPNANQAFQMWCCAWATEALRIAKPGALMLVSGGTRTFHRMAAGLEDAGWQIRDCLMWLYGSGFPKSHNLHGTFEGWGTALKPAWEPIIVAMKPIDGTFAENAEKWGVAGLNVDGGRIEANEPVQSSAGKGAPFGPGAYPLGEGRLYQNKGRWPANLILDEDAARMLDWQSGDLQGPWGKESVGTKDNAIFGAGKSSSVGGLYRDSGGASRFFYVAKSAKAERNEGCEEMPAVRVDDGRRTDHHVPHLQTTPKQNHHPTVKPLSLMKYLCNLTKTPTGGIVLDPFCGSGTTLWAAEYHNRPWIGIEMNLEYVAIANARIARERAQMKMAI